MVRRSVLRYKTGEIKGDEIPRRKINIEGR